MGFCLRSKVGSSRGNEIAELFCGGSVYRLQLSADRS